MDPLRLLRDAFAKNQIQNVSIDADSIVFPKECFIDGGEKEVVVPRETSLTRFTSRVKNQKLKLDQIVFFVQKCC